MPVWAWILIALAIVALIALVAWTATRSVRTERLRKSFGPEYDRTVEASDGRREAEAELDARRRRREELDIRPLDPASSRRYAQLWTDAQRRFVDAPKEAVGEADALVTRVMRERGYPTEGFEQRSSDVSVDHPEVVENYRAAHAISLANEQGLANTEELRRAMVHYRAMFAVLLDTDGQGATTMREAR
jgi:hypothetical protein